MSKRPPVLALDIDGTALKRVDPPAFGAPNPGIPEAMQELKRRGWVICVWTCREDSKELRQHLTKHRIPFDHVNENPGGLRGSPKIYADTYLDDRALRFDGDTEGLVDRIEESRMERTKIGHVRIAAMRDELGKMATCRRVAGYLQSRSGSTPIRVSTLLKREREKEQKGGRVEELLKKASVGEKKDRALETFATVRPYVSSAVRGAVPGAMLGGILGGAAKSGHSYRLAKGLAALGAGAGLADRGIREWAKEHKRKGVAKRILQSAEAS